MLRSYLYLLVILAAISGLGWWSHRVENFAVAGARPSARDLAQAGFNSPRPADLTQIEAFPLKSGSSLRAPAVRVGENPPPSERLLEIEEITPAAVPGLKSTDKGQEVFDTKNGRSVH